MKSIAISIIASIFLCTACNVEKQTTPNMDTGREVTGSNGKKSGYAEVNGIKMYYEIYGEGTPLILIHGGGSTSQSSFGNIIPLLAGHYQIIAMELQNHGRSGHRYIPETFDQDAADVVTLLNTLKIKKASVLGFSNGGTTAMLIASLHPELIDKLVLAAPAYRRNGFPPGFFDGMKGATINNMPVQLKEAFLKVNPDTALLQNMFEKDRDRMINFKNIPDEVLQSIKAPVLLINGDEDVITNEEALTMHHLIPNCQLAIIPGGHGKYIGEVTTVSDGNKDVDFVVPMIQSFLNKESSTKK